MLRLLRGPLCAATAVVSAGAISRACSLCNSDPRVTGVTEVGATRWLKLQTLSYVDAAGRARKWDMATRTTKRSDGGPDAVAILALLRHSSQPEAVEVLLVEQFRPPVNAVTVELPAGLIDPGETAEVAALRELKEETGYVGSVTHTSAVMAMSPGLCNEAIQLCVVEVCLLNLPVALPLPSPTAHGQPRSRG